MVIEFEKSNFPPDMEVEIGMDLQLSNDQGQIFPVKVVEVKENSVMLDANHPLAGKDLTFALELVSIA
jgi:peptidylprolyl isomerase